MSYSFEDDVAFHERWLDFLRAAREKYPDLQQEKLPIGGKWEDVYTSARVVREATDVEFEATGDGKVVAHAYVKVQKGRVYAYGRVIMHHPSAFQVLERLKKKNPDAYRALVECALEEL